MGKIKQFEDLQIWKDAVKIGVLIYKLTSEGPLSKDFSAKDQLRRAAISISNNIAEGFEYNSTKSFIRFLRFSKGSAGELRSQLYVLKEARVVKVKDYNVLYDELMKVSKGIQGFTKYLKQFDSMKNANGE